MTEIVELFNTARLAKFLSYNIWILSKVVSEPLIDLPTQLGSRNYFIELNVIWLFFSMYTCPLYTDTSFIDSLSTVFICLFFYLEKGSTKYIVLSSKPTISLESWEGLHRLSLQEMSNQALESLVEVMTSRSEILIISLSRMKKQSGFSERSIVVTASKFYPHTLNNFTTHFDRI
jgi:hypothetical protein